MITSASFSKVHALREVTLTLERFTVIVGPNGCGKSTLLQALETAVQNLNNSSPEQVGILDPAEATLTLENRTLGTRLQVSRPPLHSDLATVCSQLKSQDPERFALLKAYLTRIIPLLQAVHCLTLEFGMDLEVSAESPTQIQAEELLFDFDSVMGVSALDVGRGTLATLAVLLATLNPAPGPHLVLLDNLEQSLHPSTLNRLIGVLREIQSQNPELQIVATTHSPYLLDQFKFHEVRVATHDPERGTVVASLSACPDFSKWSAVLRSGELWSYVGEAWALEGAG